MVGIRRDRYGLRAHVKVGGVQREKRFPFGTPAKEMQSWRNKMRVDLEAAHPHAPKDSIEAAITRYLALVAAMPTIEQRTQHLQLWADALGRHLPLRTVTAARIREILHQWRQVHSAATCNKRRTALMHLFTLLGGKGGANPVRDVPKFRVDDPVPRGRDPHTIDAALLTCRKSRMRAASRLLLWTGMRPEELARVQPGDVDERQRIAIIRTAKGGRTRAIPLTPQAVSAWKEWVDAEGLKLGVPKTAPWNRWIKQKTGVPDLRVYDLRHSYGTALARKGTRLDVIGAMLGHSTLDLTRRYLLAAVGPDALTATRALGRRPPKRLPAKLPAVKGATGAYGGRRRHG
jgi:integrase